MKVFSSLSYFEPSTLVEAYIDLYASNYFLPALPLSTCLKFEPLVEWWRFLKEENLRDRHCANKETSSDADDDVDEENLASKVVVSDGSTGDGVDSSSNADHYESENGTIREEEDAWMPIAVQIGEEQQEAQQYTCMQGTGDEGREEQEDQGEWYRGSDTTEDTLVRSDSVTESLPETVCIEDEELGR